MGNRGIRRNPRARRTTASQPVTALQQRVLDLLDDKAPTRPGDIALKLGTYPSSIRGALLSLEEKGRVRRAPRQQGWTRCPTR